MKKFLRKLGLVMITAGIIGSVVAGSWLAFQDGFFNWVISIFYFRNSCRFNFI